MECPILGTELVGGCCLATSGVGGEMKTCLLEDGITEPYVEPKGLAVGARTLIVGAKRLPANIQGCRIAGCGLSRLSGSHVRHLAMKSRKSSSSHLSTADRVRELGLRRLPLALTKGRGTPVESAVS
jgi:hypothetical protein